MLTRGAIGAMMEKGTVLRCSMLSHWGNLKWVTLEEKPEFSEGASLVRVLGIWYRHM
jgi:hypothetical protein